MTNHQASSVTSPPKGDEAPTIARQVGLRYVGDNVPAIALQEYEKFDSQAQAKKNIVRAIESVAEKLGNTPSVCRKCYVHPAILEAYLDGTTLKALGRSAQEQLTQSLHALKPEEAAVLSLLQQRLRNAG